MKEPTQVQTHDLPRTLFRYRPGNDLYRLYAEVERGQIFLSEAGGLNDYLDGLGLAPIEEEVEVQTKMKLRDGRDLDTNIQVRPAAVSASFSTSPSNPQMWSVYSERFSGLVLGYDAKLLTTAVNERRDEMAAAAVELGGFTLDLRAVDYDLKPGDTPSGITEAYFRKTAHWAHENEWRIAGRVPLFMGERGKLLRVPSALTHVVFGANFRPEGLDVIASAVAQVQARHRTSIEIETAIPDKGRGLVKLHAAGPRTKTKRLTAALRSHGAFTQSL